MMVIYIYNNQQLIQHTVPGEDSDHVHCKITWTNHRPVLNFGKPREAHVSAVHELTRTTTVRRVYSVRSLMPNSDRCVTHQLCRQLAQFQTFFFLFFFPESFCLCPCLVTDPLNAIHLSAPLLLDYGGSLLRGVTLYTQTL